MFKRIIRFPLLLSRTLCHFPSKHISDFQNFFNISLQEKPTSSKMLSYYKILKRKGQYKSLKTFFIFNSLVFFGLLILPGSKIAFQYNLKFYLNDIYTDILMTLSTLNHSPDFIDYVSDNLFDSLLNLSKEGIYEPDYVTKNLNRMNRLIEENPKNENILRGALLKIGALLRFISKEQQDTFIDLEFQEGLRDFLGLIVKGCSFKESFEFQSDRINLLNEDKFIRLVDSYKEIINVANALLGYQKEVESRTYVYEKLMDLLGKKNSEIFGYEDIFTNVNGLNYLLRDLKESNDDLNEKCLKLMTFLFNNEAAAIKLLKIRIISNLIKHILVRNEKNYQEFIAEILEKAEKIESREILLNFSKDFEPELQNLKQILNSKDFKNELIKAKLQLFLKNPQTK